jgi:hypothetical protein
MKKTFTLILVLFASCHSFAQNFTLKVTVPATTNVCYIGGDLNGWTPQPLTLLTSNTTTKVFKIEILKSKFTNVFKILSGPEWMYEQVEDNWAAVDVKEDVGITVSAFKAIYNPTTSSISIDFNKPLVQVLDRKIIITGVTSDFSIFDIQGRILQAGRIMDSFSSKNLNPGIYIVRVGGKSFKQAVQ